MPGHNLREVYQAIKLVMTKRRPKPTVEELMAVLPGPDFPSGGIVVDDGLAEAYATGRGSFRIRARAEIVKLTRAREGIVVTELPFQVGPERVVSRIQELVRNGKLNGLAVTTAKRWPLAPNIPTLSEAAVPGFTVTAWDGLWAPKGTPKEVIDVWNAAARKALTDPALRDKLLANGAEPSPTSPAELGDFVKSEIPRWGKAVEQSGAKID